MTSLFCLHFGEAAALHSAGPGVCLHLCNEGLGITSKTLFEAHCFK